MTEEYSKAMCNGKAMGLSNAEWEALGAVRVTFGELGAFALLTD